MTEKITLKNIYDVVNRLEDKLDGKIGKLGDRIDVLENATASLKTRMNFFTMAQGAISIAIGGISTWLGSRTK